MATEVTESYGEHSYPGAFRQRIVRGTIDTDGSGNGSLTVSIDGYGAAPIVQVTSDSGTTANVTANSFDVSISGGATSSTVDVEALVIGPPGVA